jgi:hypothetical protein
MITVSSSTALAPSGVPLDDAETPASAAPPAHEAPAADPVAAYAANFGLHPDVAKYADPKQAVPLQTKEDKAPLSSPPAQTSCKAPDKSYDVAAVTDAEIKDLRKCGHRRLADTIANAKAAYGDLLKATPPVRMRVITSEGNGGQPVLVITGPKFKGDAGVHVHTHYHGDNGTVADPLGSKAGINQRIRDVILKEDPQAMFVLPEADNSPSQPDSPTHDADYHVDWSNAKDQVRTVDDALAAMQVDRKAVTERVVSAHSGGGMALNNLINADAKGGSRLQADRLELYDCLYHFNLKVGEKDGPDGKKIPVFEQPREWWTDARLAAWSKTPNGQSVKQVTFYSAGSDDRGGTRSGQVSASFPPDGHGTARFRLVDMKGDHYGTVSRHLGERPKP